MEKFVIAALVIGLTPMAALAQRGPWAGSGGWGSDGHWGRIYNPSNVVTIDGTVSAIENFAPPRGMSQGVHLVLATKDGKLTILLGPAWYVDHQDATLAVGDTVQVVGARATLDGKDVIVAKSVTKGDQILQLRDDNGVPFWAGCRRR
jgi:hypothetical protein